MIALRRTFFVSALAFALAGCTDPARPGSVGRFGMEAVVVPPAAVSVPLPAAAAPTVPEAPEAPAAAPSAAVRPSGGSGGGGSAAVQLEGRVVDASGAPVVGAVVRGEGFEAVVGERGTFLAPRTGLPLTVEAPGYASLTAGPPYQFALEALVPPAAGTAFTLSGVTEPPLARAVVTYADAGGTVTSTRTADDGSFSLVVEPVGPAEAPGAIAVYENLTLAGRPRAVLQATPARLGALSLPEPAAAGPLRLVVAEAAADATVAASMPGGLVAEEAVLSLTSDQGVNLPLVGSEGGWPATVPVFAAAGFAYTVTISAAAPDDSGRTVAERVGLAPAERWAPALLELPEATEAPRPGKKCKWKRKGPHGAMALYSRGAGKPAWESTADTALPALSGDFEVELQTWDSPHGIKKAASADRRYAMRRVPVEPDPVASP